MDSYQGFKNTNQTAWHFDYTPNEPKKVFQTAETQDQNRYCGHLKFFDEAKNYGFLGRCI
jgi:hypothetical protein